MFNDQPFNETGTVSYNNEDLLFGRNTDSEVLQVALIANYHICHQSQHTTGT